MLNYKEQGSSSWYDMKPNINQVSNNSKFQKILDSSKL